MTTEGGASTIGLLPLSFFKSPVLRAVRGCCRYSVEFTWPSPPSHHPLPNVACSGKKQGALALLLLLLVLVLFFFCVFQFSVQFQGDGDGDSGSGFFFFRFL